MNIVEDIDVVNPVEDDVSMNIAENVLLDPLGVGVDAIYVFGDYVPSSQLDTKRTGRLDISFDLG